MLNNLICMFAKSIEPKNQVRHLYHMPNLKEVLSILQNEKSISEYQRYQNPGRKIGKKGDISVSWVAIGSDRYVYAGIYRNTQDRTEIIREDGWIGTDYKCEKVENDYDSLIGKLVITLEKKTGQSWVRIKKMPVASEEVQSSVVSYPGHDEVLLDFNSLKQAVFNPAFREAWAHVWAVYRLVNKKNGKVYIGSACGENGLLQRIEAYASWSHSNLILKEVNPEDIQLSIIYAIDKDYITRQEILEKEYREIEKTMSYLYGYNHGGLEANRKRLDILLLDK